MINVNSSFSSSTCELRVRVYLRGGSRPCFERLLHNVDLSSFPFDSCASSLGVLFGSADVEVSFCVSFV